MTEAVASRSFALSAFATRDEVGRAVVEWGREMGWLRTSRLTFEMNGLTGPPLGVEVVLFGCAALFAGMAPFT
jgi:hypothetical protein